MVHLCDVCKNEEAGVYCFADQAVLCSGCDQRLHGSKSAVKKHERVKLQKESEAAKCDICQDAKAVLFCSEDRALICRRCDVMIHSANEYVAKHHRYLLSGVGVGLKALDSNGSSVEDGASKRPYSLRNTSNAGASTSGREKDSWRSSDDRSSWKENPAQNPGSLSVNGEHSSQASLIGMANGNGALTGASILTPFGHKDEQRFRNDEAKPRQSSEAGPSVADWTHEWGGTADLGRPDSSDLTLAAELLGIPTVSNGFTAKDIDAAYIFDDEGDFDNNLSALLEVPNFDMPFDDTPVVTNNRSVGDPTGDNVATKSLAAMMPQNGLKTETLDGLVPSMQHANLTGTKRVRAD